MQTLLELETELKTEDFQEISGERFDKVLSLSLNTKSEDEMMRLTQYKNPFINREIAKNLNITVKVMTELLDNYSAFTMNMNIAKNPNLTKEIIDKLYLISNVGHYKDSRMNEYLNKIFNKA